MSESGKETGFTPGPWKIDGDIKTMTHGCTSRPIACDEHQIAYVFVDSGKFEGDVGDANARLIAAAPALYELLTLAVEDHERQHRDGPFVNQEHWSNRARSALLLSTGGTGNG